MERLLAIDDRLGSRYASVNQFHKGLTLLAALMIYGLLSSPFPDSPGLIEGMVAGLLVLFVTIPVGFVVMIGDFPIYRKYNLFPVWIHVGFFALLWIGLFNGIVVQGWQASDLIRDVIPFIYLFMPLLLVPVMVRTRLNWKVILPWALSLVGIIFAVRFFIVIGIAPWEIGTRSYFDNFLYLPYDPSVVFAAVFLPIMAIQHFKVTRLNSWLAGLLMLVGGMLCLASLMAIAQRAPIGLAVGCYFVYGLCHSLKKFIALALILVFVFFAAQSQISGSFQLLADKQEEVGANGKLDELRTVFHETSDSVESLFFGTGWGGLFNDPIYGDEPVSYTHSVITFFLLKAGLTGLFLFFSYFFWVVRRALRNVSFKVLPGLLAAIVPIAVGFAFQPSYKTLTYGIVLAYLCMLHKRQEREDGNVGT
ncbi:hypothetical protein [Paenibacillus sp. UNC496MF]|uniref:hypothetical protein n=1 Tax=Paenibacillus sp. UNC496MF TaxID=1502753 RepID=UPI00210BEB72|nr:hypothetical protein [Paenibacillus sp. UNC496MF]